VTDYYRRTESEMPGREEERMHARQEGVQFEFLVSPVRFLATRVGTSASSSWNEYASAHRMPPAATAGADSGVQFLRARGCRDSRARLRPDTIIAQHTPQIKTTKKDSFRSNPN